MPHGGMMTARMAEIRFPARSRRHRPPSRRPRRQPIRSTRWRRRSGSSTPPPSARPARSTPRPSCARDSRRLGHARRPARRARAALVDRTEEIRADCERLSALMERTAKLVAERDAERAPCDAAPEPEAATPAPPSRPTRPHAGSRRARRPAAGARAGAEPAPRRARRAATRPRARWSPASRRAGARAEHLRGRPPDRHPDGDRGLEPQSRSSGACGSSSASSTPTRPSTRSSAPAQRSRMTMADPAPRARAGLGASSELRRSVSQATERIHEIIDAAERVAVEIRTRRGGARPSATWPSAAREADRCRRARGPRRLERARRACSPSERPRASSARLDAAAAASSSAVLGEPRAPRRPPLAGARAAASRRAAEPAAAPEPEATSAVAGVRRRARPERRSRARLARPTAEALLRATQMAVTGKDRDEIVAVLRADFPSVDADVDRRRDPRLASARPASCEQVTS